MCRAQLPVWQQFIHERPDFPAALLTVAIDAQGPERIREVVEPLGVTFPVLIDAGNALGSAYGFVAVPNGFVVDSQGILRYQRLSRFNIAHAEIRAEIIAAARGEAVVEAEGGQATAPGTSGRAPLVGEAGALFSLGVTALEAGRRNEALMLWRKARALDPDNFIIRKQIWAAEHPDRFYPEIDLDWQKDRLARGE